MTMHIELVEDRDIVGHGYIVARDEEIEEAYLDRYNTLRESAIVAAFPDWEITFTAASGDGFAYSDNPDGYTASVEGEDALDEIDRFSENNWLSWQEQAVNELTAEHGEDAFA